MNKGRLITLAHGNGGRFMRELIDEVFVRQLAGSCRSASQNAEKLTGLDANLDAAPIALPTDRQAVVTTDSFIVQPLEFPGGDIGTLAVNGSVNDLVVSGATPLWLTLSVIIEEGLEFATLERIAASIAVASAQAGVQVVAGDTKVVPHGQGGGLYLSITAVGHRAYDCHLGFPAICENDAILVSGPIGEHAISVLLAREAFELTGSVGSDCAAVAPFALPLATNPAVRFMRDPTRGGLATVAHEIAHATGLAVHLNQAAIPVSDPVRSVCDILGYDFFYLACEGRVVAVVAPDISDDVLALWHRLPGGEYASRIGTLTSGLARVILETDIGGTRLLDELEDDPLPRIC